MIDQDCLQILLKAPKKKYIKKLVEYSIAVSYNPKGCPSELITPISQEYPNVLELTSQQSHKIITALIQLLNLTYKLDFDVEKIGKLFSQNFDQQLKDILIDILSNLADDIRDHQNRNIKQGSQLMRMNWKLDMQIANEKGKSNIPIVYLDIDTSKKCKIESCQIQMKGQEFNVFFKNLQKIKQQLSNLIKQ